MGLLTQIKHLGPFAVYIPRSRIIYVGLFLSERDVWAFNGGLSYIPLRNTGQKRIQGTYRIYIFC